MVQYLNRSIEIVCHRGANQQAPENTFAGAQLCVDWGVDYIEIEHDSEVISDLLTVMGQYLVTRAIYPPDRRLLGASAAGN